MIEYNDQSIAAKNIFDAFTIGQRDGLLSPILGNEHLSPFLETAGINVKVFEEHRDKIIFLHNQDCQDEARAYHCID